MLIDWWLSIPVDDEESYSDEDDQDPLDMDNTRRSTWEDSG
jgi:hypothetical protein